MRLGCESNWSRHKYSSRRADVGKHFTFWSAIDSQHRKRRIIASREGPAASTHKWLLSVQAAVHRRADSALVAEQFDSGQRILSQFGAAIALDCEAVNKHAKSAKIHGGATFVGDYRRANAAYDEIMGHFRAIKPEGCEAERSV